MLMLPLEKRCFGFLVALTMSAAVADDKKNFYNDPFVQATSVLASCPEPEGPSITEAEMRSQAHSRSDRGTSCYRSGRCRLPNSYLYDVEIVTRVDRLIQADDRFRDSSVWILGQRRWVYLQGCVANSEQSIELEKAVRNAEDVEIVINQLSVGTSSTPMYPVK